jgi:tape measure domain-containing protein
MPLRQRLELDSSSYIQNLRRAEAGLERFSRRAKTAGGDAGKRFGDGARDAERAWGSSTGRIRTMLTGLGATIAAVFSVRAIAGFVRGMVDANSTVQQLQTSFTQLTKSSAEANRLLDEIKKRGDAIPVSFEDAAGSVRQLLAFGFDSGEVMNVFDVLMDAGASQGVKGLGTRMEQIARGIGQIQAKGKVATEELNQLREAGIDASGILARELGISGDVLADRIQKGALSAKEGVTALLQGLTTEFGGSAEAMANTFEGKLVRVQTSFEELKRVAGQEFFAAVEGQLGALDTALSDMARSDSFRDAIQDIGKALAELVRITAKALPILIDLAPALSMGAIAYAGTKALQILSSGWTKLTKEVGGFRGVIKTSVDEYTKQMALARAASTSPWGDQFISTGTWQQELSAIKKEVPHAAAAVDELSNKLLGSSDATDILAGANKRLGRRFYRFNDEIGEFVVTPLGRMRLAFRGVATRVKSVGKALNALVSTLGLYPLIIFAAVTAVSHLVMKFDVFSRSLSDTTQKILDQTTATDRLRQSLQRLSGTALAGAVFEAREGARKAGDTRRNAFSKLTPDQQRVIAGLNPEQLHQALQATQTLATTSKSSRVLGRLTPGGREWRNAQQTLETLGIRGSNVDQLATAVAARVSEKVAQSAVGASEHKATGDHLAMLEIARAALTDLETTNRGLTGAALEANQRKITARRAEIARLEEQYAAESLLPSTNTPTTPTTNTRNSDAERAQREREARIERNRELLDRMRSEARIEAAPEGLREVVSEIVQAEQALEELREGRDQVIADLGGDAATVLSEREGQLTAQIERLQEKLRTLSPAEVMEPMSASQLVDVFGDPAAMLSEASAAVETYKARMVDLQLQLERGAITQDEFNEAATQAGADADAALSRLLDRMEALGLLTPEVKAQILDLFQAIETVGEKADEKWSKVASRFNDVVQAGDNLARILDAIGASGLGGLVTDLTDIAAEFERVASARQALKDGTGSKLGVAGAQLGMVGAAAGLFAGVVSAIQARKAADRAFREAIEKQVKATQANTDALLRNGQVGTSVSRASLDAVGAYLDSSPSSHRAGRGDLQALLDQLSADGADVSDIQTLLDQNPRSIAAAQAALREWFLSLNTTLGTYTDDVGGALSYFADAVRLSGLEGADALDVLIQRLLSADEDLGDLSGVLGQLGGIDPTTAEGQRAIQEIISGVFDSVAAGTFDFGSLTPDELREVLDQFLGLQGGAGSVSQGINAVSQITEVQGNQLLGYQQEILRTGQAQLSALQGLLYAATGAGNTPTVPRPRTDSGALTVDVTVNAASDTESIVRAAAGAVRKEVTRSRTRRRL